MSFNGTVRALPLDSDYIAIGWRQDVFVKHGISPVKPPETIEELADLSERLNGLDHNGDGEPDWGVCLTPQVNYFYAFVAPVLQTRLHDPVDGSHTGQNLFFDTDTFEPLLRVPGFRYALEQYWRVIRSSNCQGQLANGEKCDRKTAFPTGRCAMVISMPGTLTSFLVGSRMPVNRTDALSGEVEWSISEQPLGSPDIGTYWGRRAPFPGSAKVQVWNRTAGYPLVDCNKNVCPLGVDENKINVSPFFAEGGEAYALNGRQSKPAARDVMWDLFAWLSELPVTKLPLSGQYRKSHLSDESRQDLVEKGGWPDQAVDDLFALLDTYFKPEDEGGNPSQDLLMLGFPDYMGALDEELHDKFFGVKPDSQGGLFDKTDPTKSISPEIQPDVFDTAYENFIDALEERYYSISMSITGGMLGQIQRWRQSLNMPWRSNEEICSTALSIDPIAFDRLECIQVVDMKLMCQVQPANVAKFDSEFCDRLLGSDNPKLAILIPSIVGPFLFIVAMFVFLIIRVHKENSDSVWIVDPSELFFDEPRKIIGTGTFGVVHLAEYRGTLVAVKQVLPPQKSETAGSSKNSLPEMPQQSAVSSWGGMGMHESQSGHLSKWTSGNKSVSTAFFGPKSRTEGTQESYSKLKNDFIVEMRLLSRLRHPCITTVMGAIVEKTEQPCLVMEYMELGSLYEVVNNKSIFMDGDVVLPILQDIVKGMRFLHAADPPVIHGDLKVS